MSKYIYGGTISPFETAKSNDVASEFEKIETSITEEVKRIDDSIKFPSSESVDIRITETSQQRANKVLGFDAFGNLQLQDGIGLNRGAHSESQGTDYILRDMIIDAAGGIGTVNNVYTCNSTHTSTAGGLSGDEAKWDLLIDLTGL